jgi:hypothetical protein
MLGLRSRAAEIKRSFCARAISSANSSTLGSSEGLQVSEHLALRGAHAAPIGRLVIVVSAQCNTPCTT